MNKVIIPPIVSVIMPAYNAAAYIQESINSVVAQTYSDWELIIADDGSTDDTVKIVNQWLEKDKRIQYFFQENGKQGKARNLAISKSKGKYLAFLDADDLWLPEKLEIQLQDIQKKNVDLVFSDSYIFSDSNVLDRSKRMNISKTILKGNEALELFLKANRIPILTVLAKKEKILSVNGFSEKLSIQNAEDYHLWLKLLISNRVFYSSDKVLAKYRIHNGSVTAIDNMAANKLLDVFCDLMADYPSYKALLERAMKEKFKQIYKTNLFTKPELGIWIRKNTQYLSKCYFSSFYLFLNFVLPTKITKRILIYILNA